MRDISQRPGVFFLSAVLAVSAPAAVFAQQEAVEPNIVVTGEALPDKSAMTAGPELKGVITARAADKIRVTTPNGASTLVFVDETTKIKTGGLFGGARNKQGAAALLNGMPVTVKTMQAGSVLLASQVTYRSGDLKTAT